MNPRPFENRNVIFTISLKGLVLVSVPLVFQLAFGAAVSLYRGTHAEAERWAIHTKDVIALAQEIQASVTDAHAAIRGAVIARDPRFATPFHEAVRTVPDRLRELDT